MEDQRACPRWSSNVGLITGGSQNIRDVFGSGEYELNCFKRHAKNVLLSLSLSLLLLLLDRKY